MTFNQGGWQPRQGGSAQPGWGQQVHGGGAQGGYRQPVWGQQPGWGQPGWGQPGGRPLPGATPVPGQWSAGPVRPSRPRRSPATTALACVGVVVVALLALVVVSMWDGGGTDVAYQNESYSPPPVDSDPPEVPFPSGAAQARSWMEENPVYEQSVPRPIRCDAPDIDLESASKAQLKSHMEDVMGCLMREWDVPVQQAGFVMPRPSVTVYDQPIKTACGKVGTKNAFYCGADQQVYYASDLPKVIPAGLRDGRFVVEAIMAHEFAHAVQARTGVLYSAKAFVVQAGEDTPEGRLISRRIETQADCFAGLFLGSVAQSTGMNQRELDNLLKVFEAIGDDTLSGDSDIDGDHGRAATRRYWAAMGLASTQVRACNTFVAPESTLR